MQEVDGLPVDLRCELREGVEPGFLCSPIVTSTPVGNKFLHVAQRHTPAPANTWYFVRPLCLRQSILQVVDCRLRNMDGKWLDCHLRSLLVYTAGTKSSYLDSIPTTALGNVSTR